MKSWMPVAIVLANCHVHNRLYVLSLPSLVRAGGCHRTRSDVRVLQVFHPMPTPLSPSSKVGVASCSLQDPSYIGVPRTMPRKDDSRHMPIRPSDTSLWSAGALR